MDLSKETYELIGRLSFEYNKLQFFLAILYNTFSISSESGFRVLKEKGLPRLLNCINMFSAQIKLTDENQICIKDLIQDIIQVKERRNTLIHSLVFTTEDFSDEQVIPFFESIRRNEIVLQDINHSDLHDLINKTKELAVQIIVFTINLEKYLRDSNLR